MLSLLNGSFNIFEISTFCFFIIPHNRSNKYIYWICYYFLSVVIYKLMDLLSFEAAAMENILYCALALLALRAIFAEVDIVISIMGARHKMLIFAFNKKHSSGTAAMENIRYRAPIN